MIKTNRYGLIMAGGVGSRFWPVSRSHHPKQFQDMLGTGESLLQTTFRRLSGLVPPENILILTNESYVSLVKDHLPMVSEDRIIPEPALRNTAPCLLLAALKLIKENSNSHILVAPSDHWIEDEEAFARDIDSSFKYISQAKELLTLGIVPSYANTGYGYIQTESDDTQNSFKKVIRFTEKPNKKLAEQFLAKGNYYWNSGIFLWKAEVLLEAFRSYQPEMYELFMKGWELLNTSEERNFLIENYSRAADISIDYAILEKHDRIALLPAKFDWNDLGTWGSLYEKLEKDIQHQAVVNTEILSVSSKGNLIRASKEKRVVIEGLNDFIIVDTEEVLMILPRDKEQDVKILRSDAITKWGTELS